MCALSTARSPLVATFSLLAWIGPVSLLAWIGPVDAHMAPWVDSMYGGTKTAQMPSQGRTWDDYWLGGKAFLADPPKAGKISTLQAGKSITLPIACQGNLVPGFMPGGGELPPTVDANGFTMDACSASSSDPFFADPTDALAPYHTSNTAFDPTQLAGCALGIVDEPDPLKADPLKMTIFSVQHNCVSRQNTEFQCAASR